MNPDELRLWGEAVSAMDDATNKFKWIDSVNKFLMNLVDSVSTEKKTIYAEKFKKVSNEVDRNIRIYFDQPEKLAVVVKIAKFLYKNFALIVYSGKVDNEQNIELPTHVTLEVVEVHMDLIDTKYNKDNTLIKRYNDIKRDIEFNYNGIQGGSRHKRRKLTSRKRRTKGKNGIYRRMRSSRLRH